MATTTKPIRQVSKTITPAGSNLILLDDGISMGKATLSDGVSAVAGDLIDTAIDDLNLGTAAQSDAVDFATAAQGTKADSAVQPDDIGTMATETASDYTKTSDLAAVATSNDYGDLSNLPTLGTGAALDAPSDPDLSNDTDKLALRGDVDANLVLQYAADDTALKGMDIASRKAGLNLANEGWWLSTSDDISAEITAGDPRYRSAGDGGGGGWYRAGSASSGQIRISLGANYLYWGDVMRVGGEAVKHNGELGVDGKGGFLWDDTGGTTTTAWMEAKTILSVGGIAGVNGDVGVTGAIKGAGIGAISTVVHQVDADAAPTTKTSGWAQYIEGRRNREYGTTWGCELDIINLIESPATAPFDPYGHHSALAGGAGTTFGFNIACGGGGALVGTVYDTDVALYVSGNGAKFMSGLVFGSAALTPDSVTGRMHAIKMTYNQALEFHTFSGSRGVVGSLSSMVTVDTNKQELQFADTGLQYLNGAGTVLFRVGLSSSAVDGLAFIPGPNPRFEVIGSDTNVTGVLRGKGTGGWTVQNGSAVNLLKVDGIQFTFRPPAAAPTLSVNGEVTVELTDNTTLTFKARGSDGTTRSGTITLA